MGLRRDVLQSTWQAQSKHFLSQCGRPDESCACVCTGKGNYIYNIHGGLALETQVFADFVHHETFPQCILRPGETYRHVWAVQFYTHNGTTIVAKNSLQAAATVPAMAPAGVALPAKAAPGAVKAASAPATSVTTGGRR